MITADKCINRRIVLKAGATLAAAGPALVRAGHAEAQPRANRVAALFAYVGAFTTPERKGHGGGINVYRVDPTSAAWTHEQLLEIVNPSFLTLDRAQRFLYSVHADLEEVSAYAIDKENGRITALNRQSCGGKNAVHLSIDPTGRWIVTANYSAGSVGVVPIEKDGTLGPRSDLVNLPGEPGPDRKQQASSHPHDAVFDPSGRFIAVPDKGLDRVFVFRLDTASGKLMPNDPPFVATRAGAGPRHIAFHPQMPLAYVIKELSSSVTIYRFDPQRGGLQPIQVLPSMGQIRTFDEPILSGAKSDAPVSPIIVDAPETIQFREFEDILKFRPRDRPVQFRILIGAIAGAVLVHHVEIGVRRDLFGDEAQSLRGSGDAVWQHEGHDAQGRACRCRDRRLDGTSRVSPPDSPAHSRGHANTDDRALDRRTYRSRRPAVRALLDCHIRQCCKPEARLVPAPPPDQPRR